METPGVYEPRWEEIEQQVEELYRNSDMALFAIYKTMTGEGDGAE